MLIIPRIKAGYDKDEILVMDRSDLFSTCAKYLLTPPLPETPEKEEGGAVCGMSAEEWVFRKQVLESNREEDQRVQKEFELQREKTKEGRRAEAK